VCLLEMVSLKIKHMSRAGLIFGLFLLTNGSIAGGGWPQGKGNMYFKLNQYVIVADRYFTPSGDVIDITTTGYYATSLYGEVGITDRLTATLYFPFFVRSTLNRIESPDGELIMEGDQLNSIGDTDIAMKYTFLQKKGYALSGSVLFGLPLGEPNGGRTMLLQSGDGEFNQLFQVDASKSLGSGKTYVSVYTGFNNRTNNFSDEIRYGAEFGYSFKGSWAIVRVQGIKSLMNGNADLISTNGIFSNNIEYVSITPEINYALNEQWGLSASIGLSPYAKRILAAPSYSLGVYWQP